MDQTGDRILGVLAVVAAASIWATLGLFAKILYAQGVSFESLVAVRASVGWVAVMIFVLATGKVKSLRVSRRDLAFLVPLGLVGIGIFYLLYFYTVRESTVGTAAILLYSSPAFVVVLARLFLKEGLNVAKVLALSLTAGGIFLVAAPTSRPTWMSLPRCSYGPARGPVLRPVFDLRPSRNRTLATLHNSELRPPFRGPAAHRGRLPTLDTLVGLPASSYALLLMLSVVHTSLGFALYTFGLGRLGAGRAAIVATAEPVVAVVLGTALLGESLTVPKVVGALLVILGAALAQVRFGKRLWQDLVGHWASRG